ncbi:MAG TPA: helix-turn-helix domain-containing protein, partial [Actinomycetales bacterium]|nr:helix-turn-helix domain-containing protein [Actinomycetales bacterium]
MSVQHAVVTGTRPDTRSAVRELLLERGALTAGEIGQALGLTAAGVRRHLDHLVEAGEVEPVRR